MEKANHYLVKFRKSQQTKIFSKSISIQYSALAIPYMTFPIIGHVNTRIMLSICYLVLGGAQQPT